MSLFETQSDNSGMNDDMERLKHELQLRIGTSPIIENVKTNYGYEEDPIIAFKVHPKSGSEISRIIRVAKTMRCIVRGCGSSNRINKASPGDDRMIYVDCSNLCDQPKISMVEVPRIGIVGLSKGLRILAGATIKEVSKFLVHNQIQLVQGFENANPNSNFVGYVISGAFGNAFYDNKRGIGASLDEELVSIRIYDSEGNLQEYSAKEDVQSTAVNFGLLGVVYDITLRYFPMTVSRIQNEFITMEDMCKYSHLNKLEEDKSNFIMGLIYIPLNGFTSGPHDFMKDLVLLRTGKELNVFELSDNKVDSEDSDPLMMMNFRDPNIENPEARPAHEILKSSFLRLHRKLHKKKVIHQYTPWALNATKPFANETLISTFKVNLGVDFHPFDRVMKTILDVLKKHCSSDYSFCPVDTAIRVNFTNVSLHFQEPGTPNQKVAIIKLLSQVISKNPEKWEAFYKELSDELIIKYDVQVDWKSYWSKNEATMGAFQKQQDQRRKRFDSILKEADREGMFLSDYIKDIFVPDLTGFQQRYRKQRDDGIFQ